MYKSSHLLANVLIVPKVAFVLRFVFIMYTRFARNYHNKRSAAALVKKYAHCTLRTITRAVRNHL